MADVSQNIKNRNTVAYKFITQPLLCQSTSTDKVEMSYKSIFKQSDKFQTPKQQVFFDIRENENSSLHHQAKS